MCAQKNCWAAHRKPSKAFPRAFPLSLLLFRLLEAFPPPGRFSTSKGLSKPLCFSRTPVLFPSCARPLLQAYATVGKLSVLVDPEDGDFLLLLVHLPISLTRSTKERLAISLALRETLNLPTESNLPTDLNNPKEKLSPVRSPVIRKI